MLVPLTTTEHGHSDLEIGHSQHTTRKLLSEAVADTYLAIIGYNIDRDHARPRQVAGRYRAGEEYQVTAEGW